MSDTQYDQAEITDENNLFQTHSSLLDMLVCPQTKSTLTYDQEAQELISEKANCAYPIRNGIPILLAEEARQLGG